MGCCYLLTSPSGKVYVGITRFSAEHRWAGHCTDNTVRRLTCAIKKYGRHRFTVSTIWESDSWEELCRVEKMFIAFYQSTNPDEGYNMREGGAGEYRPPAIPRRMKVVERTSEYIVQSWNMRFVGREYEATDKACAPTYLRNVQEAIGIIRHKYRQQTAAVRRHCNKSYSEHLNRLRVVERQLLNFIQQYRRAWPLKLSRQEMVSWLRNADNGGGKNGIFYRGHLSNWRGDWMKIHDPVCACRFRAFHSMRRKRTEPLVRASVDAVSRWFDGKVAARATSNPAPGCSPSAVGLGDARNLYEV